MKAKPVCTTCGTQYAAQFDTANGCPICSDDRQYIPEAGQAWTTLEEIKQRHSVHSKCLHRQLYELRIVPGFAIGQRALLVVTPGGNVLWDCIALMDDPIVEFVKSKGGLKAVAFSHPHYYTVMNEWAALFDCPIYIHESDEPWIFNKGGRVTLWNGREKALWDGIRIIHVGGHFPGSSVLHVPFLSPKGTLLCGDTFFISPSKKHIAAMYSYPNKIPLPVGEVQRIKKQMLSIEFDSMMGFYEHQNIWNEAKSILASSLDRYR